MGKRKSGNPTVEFLTNLYSDLPGGHIEVRFRGQDGNIVKREWCSSFERVADLVEKDGAKAEKVAAYFGVAKRSDTSKEQKRAKKCHILGTTALWADIDTAKHGWDLQKTARALYDLPLILQPSALVKSGGGLHAYWLLDEPVLFDDKYKIEQTEEVNKELGVMCSGDRIFDITRVLRLPGSYNARAKKTVETMYFFHWAKKCPSALLDAAYDFGKVLGPDGFVLPKDMPKEYQRAREFDPVALVRDTLGVGKARSRREELIWENTRPGGGYPYYGINEAELLSTCNLYFLYDSEWKVKREAIINKVLNNVEEVMSRNDPAEFLRWNIDAEYDAVADKLDRWHKQWAIIAKDLKTQKAAERKAARASAQEAKTPAKEKARG